MPQNQSHYYDENYSLYKSLWSESFIHYGFWDKNIQSHEDSLIQMIVEISNRLKIKNNNSVLDAGCGAGGSTRYIAAQFAARVTGIANSETLLRKAKNLDIKFNQGGNTAYLLADYHNTCFKDNSFDKILFIESACYSTKHKILFDEIYRLLKPGGSFIIADFFRTKKILSRSEKGTYHEWLDGWAMPLLPCIEHYRIAAETSGLKNFALEDITDRIYDSSVYMHNGAQNVLPGIYGSHIKGNLSESGVKHVISGIRQKECIDKNIWTYNFISAQKPL